MIHRKYFPVLENFFVQNEGGNHLMNKSLTKTKQDLAKSWKNQVVNTFFNQNLKRKTYSPKPRSCQKLNKSCFQYFFDENLTRKRHSPKPRSCQKLNKNFFNIFDLEIE